MSWFANIFEGFDLGDAIGAIGSAIAGSERRASIQQNAEIARLQRHLDQGNLALFIQSLKDTQAVKTQLINAAQRRRRSGEMSIAYHETEASYYDMRSNWRTWLAQSEADESLATDRAQSRVDYAQLAQIRAELASDESIAQKRGILLDTQARADATEYFSGLKQMTAQDRLLLAQERAFTGTRGLVAGREAATRRRIGAESSAREIARTGEMGVLRMAGQRAVAERGAFEVGSRLRRQERFRQAGGEIGAADASAAARGVRGSSAAAGGARAQGALMRDLEIQDAENLVQDLALAETLGKIGAAERRLVAEGHADRARTGEQEAILMLNTAQRQGEDLTTTARLGVGRAEAQRQRGQIESRFGLASAERGVQRATLEGERVSRARRGDVVDAQGRLVETRAGYAQTRYDRRIRQGEIESQQEGLASSRAYISRKDAVAQFYTADADLISQEAGKWQATAGQALAEWQLENLPSLPDYGAQGTRNSIGTYLDILSNF